MVTDLLGGSVQIVIADQANLMPHVRPANCVADDGKSEPVSELDRDSDVRRGGTGGFRGDRVARTVGPAACRPKS